MDISMSFGEFFSSPQTQEMLAQSGQMFIQLFVELSVLFLIISFAVALLNHKLPAEKVQRLLGAQSGRGYLTGAALGAITPFCSCSTIPMLIGLLKARAGFGPTMTFLFTSPLLNPIVIALFIPVLGVQITIWYALLALSTSVIAGVVLNYLGFERYIKSEMITGQKNKPNCSESKKQEQAVEQQSLWQSAWAESWQLFRTMLPYMVIAMLIGSIVHGFVPADFFAKVASEDNAYAVPTAALIGIPLYIRVTALLPLVGAFMAKGVSIGALMALVIGSGGASLPELILLRRLFNWPLLLAFLSVIFSTAVMGGYTFNYFFS